MKKILYISFLCGLSLFSFAQEETSVDTDQVTPTVKSNTSFPEKGDIAIGVDFVPYLEFIGNMFSGYTGKNTFSPSSNTIYGKYYLSDNSALRVDLYIRNTKDIDLNYVQDDANFAQNPNAQVEDKRVIKNQGYGIGLGYQLYRGTGKVRGTYGVVGSYYRGKSSTAYEFGNQMTSVNTSPTTTTTWGINPAERTLTINNGLTQSVGVGLVAGVEYFIVPQVCIGGELGIYYNYYWYGQESRTFERVEQGEVKNFDLATDPQENYGSLTTNVYDTDYVGGRLYLLFHF